MGKKFLYIVIFMQFIGNIIFASNNRSQFLDKNILKSDSGYFDTICKNKKFYYESYIFNNNTDTSLIVNVLKNIDSISICGIDDGDFFKGHSFDNLFGFGNEVNINSFIFNYKDTIFDNRAIGIEEYYFHDTLKSINSYGKYLAYCQNGMGYRYSNKFILRANNSILIIRNLLDDSVDPDSVFVNIFIAKLKDKFSVNYMKVIFPYPYFFEDIPIESKTDFIFQLRRIKKRIIHY